MSDFDPHDDPNNQLAVGLAIVATGLLAAALLAADVWWWWIAFPIGGGLIPLAQGLAMRDAGDDDEASDEKQNALDELRTRYARGELADDEFETRLERLLETETVADARESLTTERLAGRESPSERDATPDREREVE